MKVRWMKAAEQDRGDIFDYIATDNPWAASRMNQLFDEAADKLAEFPKMGKVGKIPGTREWLPHESYRIVYEIDEDTVWIMAVVHTAKLWPPER